MEKISAKEKPVTNSAAEPQSNQPKTPRLRVGIFPALLVFFRRLSQWLVTTCRKIYQTVYDHDYYRRIRVWFIRRYLQKNVTCEQGDELLVTWQPWYIAGAEALLLVWVSLRGFQYLHPLLSVWLEKGFAFFRLQLIYNFTFPSRAVFVGISRYLLLFIIAYYAFFIIKAIIPGFFSSLSVNRRAGQIYYIKSNLLVKELYVFSIPEIELIVHKQNLLTRLLGWGTLVLQKKSGDKVIIRLVKHASRLLKEISR